VNRLPAPGGDRLPAGSYPALGDIDQSRSKVSGDQVIGGKYHAGGDINLTTVNSASRQATVLEQLLVRLHEEVEGRIHCQDTVAKLRRYQGGSRSDDVIGLAAKLQRSGRETHIDDALEQKEMFSKLLESWSLYASAQEIFVHLLARAEHLFKSEIHPDVGQLSVSDVNRLINNRIVDPVVFECGATMLQIDHLTAMGMVYWLAEQCFIRWH
jgi:hypothetical protein